MKKVILGLALFAGSFALANEPVANRESKTTSDVTCSCKLSPEGTCFIYVTIGGHTTTYIYHNVTEAWCNWQKIRMQYGQQY